MLDIEFSVLNFLYELHTPLLDSIMVFITHLGDAGILWIVLGLVMLLFPKYRRAGVCVLIALAMDFIIANLILKPLVARIRPYEYVDFVNLLIAEPRDFSFPSGHSFASFASSVSVFLYHKKAGAVLIVLAFLIAFSRMYLYVHFPSDVIAGAFMGIAVAFIARAITDKLFRKSLL